LFDVVVDLAGQFVAAAAIGQAGRIAVVGVVTTASNFGPGKTPFMAATSSRCFTRNYINLRSLHDFVSRLILL
jgi:hypothetical protein